MLAIIRTRWHTRPLSRRARRRSSAAPGSLRKKYAGIVHPPNMVRLHNHSTTSRNHRKSVLDIQDFVDAVCDYLTRWEEKTIKEFMRKIQRVCNPSAPDYDCP